MLETEVQSCDALRLERQLCFPLYACSKEIVKCYTPHLDKLDLTYTQYVVMLILWEHAEDQPSTPICVNDLGKIILLDSGTLTPLLKKLEQKGYIRRVRSVEDLRTVNIQLTTEGLALKNQARDIPQKVGDCLGLNKEEALTLHHLTYKLLKKLVKSEKGENMAINSLTKDNFKEKVLKAKGVVLVDFNADWCGPCQMQAPILEELAEDYQIFSVNIDDEEDLAEEYEVASIPCLVVFKDGKETDRKIGLTPKDAIKKMMEE